MNEASPASGMRLPLYAVLTVIALSFAVAINGRLDRLKATGSQSETVPVLATRDLRFDDLPDGNIGVFDADTGATLETITPGTNNFMRGILRALVRERRKAGLGSSIPFHLTSRSDGHLLLSDPATGTVLDLGSFGTDNIGVFARLLPATGVVSMPAARAVTDRAG